MILKKFFYNSFLALKNINRYGLFLIIKSFFYEIYYSIKFQDFTFFSYDSNINQDRSYRESKTKNDYSVPDIPTPFYFLELISIYIKNENLNDFNIIDLGCGSGRLVKYFDKKFKIRFIGIDINLQVINKNLIRFNKKNYKFFNLDLKKINRSNDLDIIDNNFLNNKKNIIFISDSIDALSIIKLIPILKIKFKEFLFIMVNQKNIELFNKYYCKKKIFFRDRSRNISFYEI